MVNFILVWVLVSGSTSSAPPHISAPMVDLASCVRLQKSVQLGSYRPTQCVQIKIPK
jgi:hypothetical protein